MRARAWACRSLSESREGTGSLQARFSKLERRLPIPFHAACPKAGREVGVGDSLAAVRLVRSSERMDEGGRDRLELVIASLPQQGVLDVPQAGQVGRVLFEDRLVPE